MITGPGVTCPIASPSRNSSAEIQCSWLTTWSWMKAMMVRPPPKVSAPTLKKNTPMSQTPSDAGPGPIEGPPSQDAARCSAARRAATTAPETTPARSEGDQDRETVLDRAAAEPPDRDGEDAQHNRPEPVERIAHERQRAVGRMQRRQNEHDRERRDDEAEAREHAARQTGTLVAGEDAHLQGRRARQRLHEGHALD